MRGVGVGLKLEALNNAVADARKQLGDVKITERMRLYKGHNVRLASSQKHEQLVEPGCETANIEGHNQQAVR